MENSGPSYKLTMNKRMKGDDNGGRTECGRGVGWAGESNGGGGGGMEKTVIEQQKKKK